MIDDLEDAAELVPETPTKNIEIAKPFVKGLRARLCLIAGGYSQYPDGIKRRDNWQ
ncbi:MAG: hypothetical protein HC831_28930, partial [Chloroflexia bacterium]|nr:hypothetical protein [Chloroflexia bacterium]